MPTAQRSNKPIYLVLGCTVFAAAAQVMMKYGAGHVMPPFDPAHPLVFIAPLLGNIPLLAGYVTSAGTAFLLIMALRDGELSVLYPIIAMSYVWVALLSMYFFGDHMNIFKVAGIALIIGGVALLGRAGSRA